MVLIISIIYGVISFFIGWKIMKGRIKWCEQEGLPNKMVKVVLSMIIGFTLTAFVIVIKIWIWTWDRMATG